MFDALSDFLIYCWVERRLSELTCGAYERDVGACLEFLGDAGKQALDEIPGAHQLRGAVKRLNFIAACREGSQTAQLGSERPP